MRASDSLRGVILASLFRLDQLVQPLPRSDRPSPGRYARRPHDLAVAHQVVVVAQEQVQTVNACVTSSSRRNAPAHTLPRALHRSTMRW